MSKIKMFDTDSLQLRIDAIPSDELQDYLATMCNLLHIMQTDLDEVRNVKLRIMLHDYIEELLCEAEEEQELEEQEYKESNISAKVLTTLTKAGFTIPELKRALEVLNI